MGPCTALNMPGAIGRLIAFQSILDTDFFFSSLAKGFSIQSTRNATSDGIKSKSPRDAGLGDKQTLLLSSARTRTTAAAKHARAREIATRLYRKARDLEGGVLPAPTATKAVTKPTSNAAPTDTNTNPNTTFPLPGDIAIPNDDNTLKLDPQPHPLRRQLH
ncbi:hypothetical protein GGTG_11769 [Gaeumannomyces tritici R3-111a-1]|uniref:Uncharacterized protein n=1 Tax=Gaeumannomyces tritici (strain R3-111a-1) TaxID=644352 RepID=J3PE46_GAET3|nr:hypothetical protein GGTG_11769 [Gaeumannomyces tritici R3-111a-1]EJT70746.1 hypothetical protein GGTG_11769 [Gaeumannomyces tritici R3-111a-1]